MALDLLNYRKEREPDYELCDPNQPVGEICDLMESRCRDHGVTLVRDLQSNLAPCWMDRDGIHRCLLNLVTNAFDACAEKPDDAGPRRVVVCSRHVDGWAVEYLVEDNGCGMDEETRSKLFQRFFSTKGTKGTGLGLMITRKIVDEHAGIIGVDSEEGKGTRFSIRLPSTRKGAEAAMG